MGSVHLIIRRRRVLTVLLGGAALFALLATVSASRALWWGAVVFGLLGAGYLGLVAHITHLQVRRELSLAFNHAGPAQAYDWKDLGADLAIASPPDDRPPVAMPVTVGNQEIGRFLVCFALGWALTPVVMVIRLVRGDLIDRQGLANRIVSLQQYGRSQSLRLLAVGAAATVSISAVGAASAGATAPAATAVATTMRAAAPRAGSAGTYVVKRGDTLGSIANRYGTTVAALASANHIANPNLILPGLVLTLGGGDSPAPAARALTYTVQRGDTLGMIARRNGTTVAALVAANHIANPNLILPGLVLNVRVSAPAALPAPVPVKVTLTARVTAPTPAPASGRAALPMPVQYLRGGSVDQGVDYSAPGGTPLYAMGAGTIIREGMTGFGPGTPVLQISSGPLAGKSVYYGHSGPDLVPVGAHVVAGQQISSVGYGIVGYSTGAHLEIGFYPPGNRGAGQAMLNYINSVLGYSTG